MTRDEAIAKLDACGLTFHVVDGLVALGLLKLDSPPKTIEQRVADIVRRHTSERQAHCILGAFRNEGLLK